MRHHDAKHDAVVVDLHGLMTMMSKIKHSDLQGLIALVRDYLRGQDDIEADTMCTLRYLVSCQTVVGIKQTCIY